MNLFQTGPVTLASGAESAYKVECDVLAEADWVGLAAIAKARGLLPARFGPVLGVPAGGYGFAHALERYRTPASPVVLVADDVWTTGGSMAKFIAAYFPAGPDYTPPVHGLVAFARSAPPDWVKAVWLLGGRDQ